MRHFAFSLACLCAASPVLADELTETIVDTQILPAFETLATQTDRFAQVAGEACLNDPDGMKAAYGEAFDAWIAASLWRFGPTETDSRAFSLSFWPDNRGRIGKAVNALLADEKQDVLSAENFSAHSIAAKGFYAFEYLMFDENAQSLGSTSYRCALAQAMATDIAATSQAIWDDWTQSHVEVMKAPSARYQNDTEVQQELFKALSTGFEILEDMRLGRPLGSFDRPRPRRAEAWRSDRSLRHVILSLQAMEPLAQALAADVPDLQDRLTHGFERTMRRANALDDPQFAGVSNPASRIRIEALKQEVADLRTLVSTELGPRLGLAAGFNSLDGD